ncbi:MAG TPA: thioredoxin family protein [Planctomycetota bacterium]|nr:thioredoxin family protein [Planctomycetota bacterium]
MRLVATLLLLPLLARQEVAWKSDFKAALKEAAGSKKLVVLVFQTKDRKNCVRFENEALKDPGVIAALGKYICVRVNPEGTDDDNKLWQDQGSPMPPATVILEPDGKQLAAVTPLNPKVYGPLLNDIAPAYVEKIVPAREQLAKDPKHAGANRTLGEAYLVLDNSKASAKHYAAAAEAMVGGGDKTGALQLLVGQLEKYYEKKWYSPARGCCSMIAELDSDNTTKKRPMAAWVLGMASCAEGRWAEAIDGLKSAIEKYKGDELQPKMMFTMASAHMYSKDLQGAITVFETIMKDYPGTETADISQVQAEKLRAQLQKQSEGK